MQQSTSLFGSATMQELIRNAESCGTISADEALIIFNEFEKGLHGPAQFTEIQSFFTRLHDLSPTTRWMVDEFLELEFDKCFAAPAASPAEPKKLELPIPYVLNHIPKTTAHNRRPGLALTPKYVTIHSTNNLGSTAQQERNWLVNPINTVVASFHIVVDETQAIECVPLTEVAWHAHDGQGQGNRASLSMEMCESGDRAKTLQNGIAMAAKLLQDRGLGADKLRRHFDWYPAKNCPQILLDEKLRKEKTQTWDWFKAEVAALL